jgi:putative oxidoreductase
MSTMILTQRARVAVGVIWTLQIFSAALFLFAGLHKLTGAPDMVQAFAAIGLGQWFRYFTASIEIVAGVGLLIPAVASYAAAALAVTMVGAIVSHLFILGGNPAAAIVLLASTMTIAWARRNG